MGMFDEINKKFGNWIQVLDSMNDNVTIENFDYGVGVDGAITISHCAKCVAVNNCWFKDEKGKKPEYYIKLGIDIVDDILSLAIPGHYHYRCHCYENSILAPNVDDIKLIIPDGKVQWLFKDKQEWIKPFGYENNNQFLIVIYKLIKQAYCDGDYIIKKHDKYGVKIDLYINLPGVGNKKGKFYGVKSAFMIFPNGKLKCNTILGGRQ